MCTNVRTGMCSDICTEMCTAMDTDTSTDDVCTHRPRHVLRNLASDFRLTYHLCGWLTMDECHRLRLTTCAWTTIWRVSAEPTAGPTCCPRLQNSSGPRRHNAIARASREAQDVT